MENMWAPWRMQYIMGDTEKINGCLFCALPSMDQDEKNLIVYRSRHCFVILNKFPYNNGHTMVIPYEHTADLLSLDDAVLADCQLTIKKTIRVLKDVFHPQGINLGMNLGQAAGAGIEEHIHYHLVPRWNGDTNFMPIIGGVKVISEALQETYKKLKTAFLEIS